ncbi:unnamed protein product [Cylindrotheca closterium]|uniref:Transmembrane protein n=1 Tax=Cylindrotheca closterium TaxID=2856 RepID=A0AAD2FWD3_9STRA|nr:unnamed protein product [Cylindrotheca closterium]
MKTSCAAVLVVFITLLVGSASSHSMVDSSTRSRYIDTVNLDVRDEKSLFVASNRHCSMNHHRNGSEGCSEQRSRHAADSSEAHEVSIPSSDPTENGQWDNNQNDVPVSLGDQRKKNSSVEDSEHVACKPSAASKKEKHSFAYSDFYLALGFMVGSTIFGAMFTFGILALMEAFDKATKPQMVDDDEDYDEDL